MSLLTDLAARIDSDRLTRRAFDFVDIPSPTGQTAAVAKYFADQYRDLGCEIHVIEDVPAHPADFNAPSVAAYWRGGDGPTLQIDGHSDTIVMDHPPTEIRDGVLYGRGAVDMKASVAAVMEVVNVLKDAKVQIPGTLLMTTHGSHEAPLGFGAGLRALVDAGHRGDAAVVVEGPVDELAIAGRGMVIWNVTVHGPDESTHENSTPKGTPNPLVGAAELVVALETERQRLSEEDRPYVGCETLFVGQVHGGDFYNRFPTIATLQGTRRYFADHAFEDVKAEFLAICDAVAQRTGTRIEVEFNRVRDGYEVANDAAVVEAYRASYREIEGRDLENSAFASVGDVSVLAGEYGIPSVYCGSQGTGAHADLEVMPLAELERQTKLVLGIVLHYFGLA